MFRSIQSRISKRVESLKTKTIAQSVLEKHIRSFLIQEFGPLGESLYFKTSYDNKKLNLWFENKTAANEAVLRSTKLAEFLKTNGTRVETINIS